jgi:phage host-nuclease inhibitor protein Gam
MSEVKAKFQIDSEDKLAWYVDKLATIQEKQARITAQAEAMVADLEREADGLRFQFEGQARAMTEKLMKAAGNKVKHIKLLTGTIGFRRSPDRIAVRDEAAVLLWAEQHAPMLIARKVDSKRLAVRDGVVIVKETGEVVEANGLEVALGEEKIYVKSAKASGSDE